MGYETEPAAIEIVESATVQNNQNFEIMDDHPQDECGVYGIWAPGQPVLATAYTALRKLEHRGQSGAGVAYYDTDKQQLVSYTGMGKVPVAIPRAKPDANGSNYFDHIKTPVVLGHTRYSTANSDRASQPFVREQFGIALAHNGHIEDVADIAELYDIDTSDSVSDSDILAEIIDKRASQIGNLHGAIAEVTPQLEGAFSLVITDGKQLIGARDPWGFRPLAIGELPHDPGKYVLASEESAFRGPHAEFLRDVQAGEIVTIDDNGISSSQIERHEDSKECMFEYIYLARPWEQVNGVIVDKARKNMGRALADVAPVEADIVVAVPNSGRSAAFGYAERAGLPNEEGLYVEGDKDGDRSFILRGGQREEVLEGKHIPSKSVLQDKRVILVDDSVIKGNTMRSIVAKLRAQGAKEIHVRSAAPPYVSGCYMGMDTQDTEKLVARGRSLEGIAKEINADSIAFNSVASVHRAVNEAREGEAVGMCDSCVTGEYPFSEGTFSKLGALATQKPPGQGQELSLVASDPR